MTSHPSPDGPRPLTDALAHPAAAHEYVQQPLDQCLVCGRGQAAPWHPLDAARSASHDDDPPDHVHDQFIVKCSCGWTRSHDDDLASALRELEDWKSGRRSWTNLGPNPPYTPDVIAVMDAQEVVKLSAYIAALRSLPAVSTEPTVILDGTERADGYNREQQLGRRIGAWLDDLALAGSLSPDERRDIHISIGAVSTEPSDRLRLTGEQIASIQPPVDDRWFTDWDEFREFAEVTPPTPRSD